MRTKRRWLLGAGLLVLVTFGATPAAAGTLEGRLVDSLTGTPIPDARVRVLGTHRTTTTDADGRWEFDLPKGTYQLAFDKTLGTRHHHFRLVRQRVPQYKSADSTIATPYFLDRGAERQLRPRGAPVRRIDHPSSRDRGPVDLGELLDSPTGRPDELKIPSSAPTTIRVARRKEKDNCSNPIVAIEEMRLDEYVRGVLPPEIGVFRNLKNVEEVYKAFALAAKSYGLYFMLVHDSGNRRTVASAKPPNGYKWFHIDDTPCNQRYSDKRYSITTNTADSQKGRLLVKKDATDTLHKYEYAASCAEHGTRPEYQQKIVDDSSPAHSCVGSWCGHDDCAGHTDHPHVSGSDRCLVRGICQWGAAEWAKGGKDYKWMLEHYQPNLEIRDLWDNGGSKEVEVKGYVYTDPGDVMGSGVADATVELQGGGRTTTNSKGLYSFSSVPLKRGSVTATASKTGYRSSSASKQLKKGMTNWLSIRITTKGGDDVESSGEVGVDTATATDDTGASGGSETGTETTGRDVGRYGGLGPLVTRSRVADSSGCSCSAGRSSPSPLGLLFVIAGIGAALLRRTAPQ